MKITLIISLLICHQVLSQTNVFPTSGRVGIGLTDPKSKLVVFDVNTGVTIGAGNNLSGVGFNRNVNGGTYFNSTISGWQFTARDQIFSLEGYNGAFNNLLNVLKNGNIGIGTKSPASKLEVNGDISLVRSKKIKFLETVGGDDRAYIRSTDGKNGEDHNSLIFAVNTGDESMFLKYNGNLGIGTNKPESKFVVMDNNIGVSIGTGSNISGLGFNRSVNGGKIYNSNIHAWQFTARDERFSLEGYTSTSGSSLLNVLKNGNIGIGTESPVSKLEVNGDISLVRSKKIKFLETVGGDDRAYIRSTDGKNGEDHNSLVFAVNTGDESMFLKYNGNLGIGTSDPKNKLSVNGHIWAKEIKVLANDAPDWVFNDNYNLRSIYDVKNYIEENKHLPEIPSADEFRENDMKVSEMINKLLQKVEELTLYTIQQEEKIDNLKSENFNLKDILHRLEKLESKK